MEWLCGNQPDSSHIFDGYNAYADEQGFKRNFTAFELGAVKTVTQKTLLNAYEYAGTDNKFNQRYHIFDYYVINVLQNYETAYSEQVTDEFFLLDVRQVNTIFNNRRLLGAEYYIGKPTKECVDNSEEKYTALSDSKNWRYWLRSPNSYSGGSSVRQVGTDGYIFYDTAYKGNGGVRPAFYLDLSSANFASGSGTSADPYILGNNESVSAEISDARLTDSGAVITACLDNSYSKIVAGDVYFAVYDAVGRLSEIEKRAFSLDSLEKSEDITVTFSGSAFSAYKLFVWDNMNPLADIVSSEFPTR